jgi:hypothetical protein
MEIKDGQSEARAEFMPLRGLAHRGEARSLDSVLRTISTALRPMSVVRLLEEIMITMRVQFCIDLESVPRCAAMRDRVADSKLARSVESWRFAAAHVSMIHRLADNA